MSLNKQKIFNAAWNGLKTQGFVRSGRFDEEKGAFVCLYRGPEGRKCAFGHCIPDEAMRGEFEGQLASKVLEMNHVMDGADLYCFVDNLQQEHDRSSTPEDMRLRLARLAGEYHLEIPA